MKITHLVCAGALLVSPLLAHSQSFKFDLKDAIKKGMSDNSSPTKNADATTDNAANPSADAAKTGSVAADREAIPKVLETFGVKIGDTRQQVEQVLTSQGFKLGSSNTYQLGQNFPGILWSLVYVKNSSRDTGSKTLSMVDVRFGPQSGKVLGIRRQEKFDHVVVATEIIKALTEKYGTPSSQYNGDLNWVAYRPGFVRNKFDSDDCKASSGVNLDGQYSVSPKYKDCKHAVRIILGDSPNSGLEYKSIEVMIADFSTAAAEWTATRAMISNKNAEILEQHKKAPIPKL